MSEEQQRQKAVQVAQAEAPAPLKWGTLPPPERIAELEQRLAEWAQLPMEARSDARNPFDGGPHVGKAALTGADVFYLVARIVATSDHLFAITKQQARFGIQAAAMKLSMGDGIMAMLNLPTLDLSALHLEGAYLVGAHLKGANLIGAHLEGAFFLDAHLEGANLISAHLEGANLSRAHLEGANLISAHLEGANLRDVNLAGANLRLASLGMETALDNTTLMDPAHGSVLLADVRWGGVNLSVVDWEPLQVLGDETQADQRQGILVRKIDGGKRLADNKAAVRAYRQLAVVLQAQGLSEDAARFAYRAQLRQRHVYRLQCNVGAYLFSLLLAALAGYGHRLWRIAFTYGLVVTLFALGYYVAGTQGFEDMFRGLTGISLVHEQHVALHEAFLLGVTNIHGRVFTGTFQLASLQAWFAAAEALFGLVIEGVFVAMMIQRFFGR